MSSYDKVVKLACKPKAAVPKSKYIDTIIAATYSEDGAVNDVCRALSPKFKEPNAIVVFKALIVLHTMVRNGSTDNVLAFLSSQPSDVLRLRNVSNGQWEGYSPPQNLSNYALYLDCRIRSYKELKHDPVRVQSESNRDVRVGALDAETRRASGTGGSSAGGVHRSKTVMGRKLRVMTVEKGLLRETKIVQKLVDVLLDCQFYLDDLEDELTITALRMLVKDLLVLFQAVNEGVINVLEHYFEMSKVDAKGALSLYRTFCRQTERVVEYLTVARKLQNLLNVPIPNLKHAPVSLAGALEEYLQDPNFEQNRIEYKLAKEQAEVNAKNPKPILKKSDAAKSSKLPDSSSTTATSSTPTETTSAKPEVNKDLLDFFSSIETEQSNMFGTGSPTATSFGQPAMSNFSGPFNPFAQRQTMIMTGASPFNAGPSPFVNVQTPAFTGIAQQPSPFVNMPSQSTGFPGIQMQATGFPTSQSQPNGLLAPGNATSPFARPQSAAANFLQPQATASNPFRQSMFSPSFTGVGGAAGSTFPFGTLGSTPASGATSPFPNAFSTTTSPFNIASPGNGVQNSGMTTSPFPAAAPTSTSTSPFPFLQSNAEDSSTSPGSSAPFITRPASTPITTGSQSIGQAMAPLAAQQTGSRNPFGRPKSPPPPPVPPVPTLGELSAGKFPALNGNPGQASSANTGGAFGQFMGGQTSTSQSSPFAMFGTPNGSQGSGVTTSPTGVTSTGTMSSIASAFTLASNKPSSPPPSNFAMTNGANLFGNSSQFSPLTSQATSTSTTTSNGGFSALLSSPTGTSTTSATAPSFLQTQPTGFGGSTIKPFKPSSSFGAALLGALPTIPQGAETPSGNAPTGGTGSFATSPNGALNAQPTGFSAFGNSSFGSGLNTGGGLQPQATGANPFRVSMFGAPPPPLPTGSPFPGSQNGSTPSTSPFGSLAVAGASVNSGFVGSPLGGGVASPLQAQPTGMKAPFKPSSSFGASLFANMGAAGATTPAMPGAFPSTPTAPQQGQQPQNPVSLI